MHIFKHLFLLTVAAAFTLGLSGMDYEAKAATLYYNGGTYPSGVNGIVIGAYDYNALFYWGSYNSLFSVGGGLYNPAPLPQDVATEFSNQVRDLLNGPTYIAAVASFTNPTGDITNALQVPYTYASLAAGYVDYTYIQTSSGSAWTVYYPSGALQIGGTLDGNALWAKVYQAPHAEVPIPGAALMMISGLIGIVGIRRKIKN